MWELFSRMCLKMSFCLRISGLFKNWVFGKTDGFFFKKNYLIYLKIGKRGLFFLACGLCRNTAQEISKCSKLWDFWKCRWLLPEKSFTFYEKRPFWRNFSRMSFRRYYCSRNLTNFKSWCFLESYMGFLQKKLDTFQNRNI